MGVIGKVSGVVLAVCLLVGCSVGSERASSGVGGDEVSDGASSYLFTLSADSGTGTGETLSLDVATDDLVTVFSDRPVRKAWRVSVESLVAGWDATFGSDAPNAALVYIAGGAERTVVVELRAPVLSSGTLTFQVREIDESSIYASRTAQAGGVPDAFSNANLFIDSASCPLVYPVDCAGADLSTQSLKGVDFSDGDLTGADLSYSDLTGANFSSSSLVQTNFQYALLESANFSGAALNGASTGGAVWDNTTCPDGTNSDYNDWCGGGPNGTGFGAAPPCPPFPDPNDPDHPGC